MLLVPFLWSTSGVGVLFGLYAVVQWRLHGVAEPWILKPDTFQASPVFWGLVALSCVTQSLASFAGGYLQGLQRFSDFARLALIGSVVQIGATTGRRDRFRGRGGARRCCARCTRARLGAAHRANGWSARRRRPAAPRGTLHARDLGWLHSGGLFRDPHGSVFPRTELGQSRGWPVHRQPHAVEPRHARPASAYRRPTAAAVPSPRPRPRRTSPARYTRPAFD